MATVIIEGNSPQAMGLLEFIKTLPFAKVIEEPKAAATPKKSFREAAAECNSISVDAFFDELDNRIRKHFNHA